GLGPITVTSPSSTVNSATYVITFGGALAGFDQPSLLINGDPNTSTSGIINSGIVLPQNAVVTAGAAIELQAPNLNINKGLVLNGVGFNSIPTGALRLDNINTGSADNALVSGVVQLSTTAASSIGVEGSEDTLSLGAAGNTAGLGYLTGGNIVNQTTSGLIKVGLGTLEFGGTSTNNYIGAPIINTATLLLH